MFERLVITEEAKNSIDKYSIVTVFVTFKTMQGKRKCLKLFRDAFLLEATLDEAKVTSKRKKFMG
jgi:hypothetical protein